MHIDQSDFHDQLVRGLTHKMNNILSLFHGYLGLLMDDKKLDPSTVAGLARIRDGAKAATELMDRTKVLARPSSVVWREVNVADLFRRMQPDFDAACERGVELQIELPENLPSIWTDLDLHDFPRRAGFAGVFHDFEDGGFEPGGVGPSNT